VISSLNGDFVIKNENRGQTLGWNQKVAAGCCPENWMAIKCRSFGLLLGDMDNEIITSLYGRFPEGL
jgi:hypothetical protein